MYYELLQANPASGHRLARPLNTGATTLIRDERTGQRRSFTRLHVRRTQVIIEHAAHPHHRCSQQPPRLYIGSLNLSAPKLALSNFKLKDLHCIDRVKMLLRKTSFTYIRIDYL